MASSDGIRKIWRPIQVIALKLVGSTDFEIAFKVVMRIFEAMISKSTILVRSSGGAGRVLGHSCSVVTVTRNGAVKSR